MNHNFSFTQTTDHPHAYHTHRQTCSQIGSERYGVSSTDQFMAVFGGTVMGYIFIGCHTQYRYSLDILTLMNVVIQIAIIRVD